MAAFLHAPQSCQSQPKQLKIDYYWSIIAPTQPPSEGQLFFTLCITTLRFILYFLAGRTSGEDVVLFVLVICSVIRGRVSSAVPWLRGGCKLIFQSEREKGERSRGREEGLNPWLKRAGKAVSCVSAFLGIGSCWGSLPAAVTSNEFANLARSTSTHLLFDPVPCFGRPVIQSISGLRSLSTHGPTDSSH